jgi:hypothetical protein
MNADEPRPRVWAAVLTGASLGLAWGVAARVWMRLISASPEFSVGGTAFILALPTVFGACAGLAFAARRRGWRRWRHYGARAAVVTAFLLLGIGPGAPLVFSVLAFTLALTQSAFLDAWLLAVAAALTRRRWALQCAADGHPVHRANPWLERGMRAVLLLLALAAFGFVAWQVVTDKPGLLAPLYILFYLLLLCPLFLGLRVGLAPSERGLRRFTTSSGAVSYAGATPARTRRDQGGHDQGAIMKTKLLMIAVIGLGFAGERCPAREPKERAVLRVGDGPGALAVTADGKALAAAVGQTVRVFDPARSKEIATLKGHRRTVVSLAFSPDGKTLASGDRGGALKLWDMASGKETALGEHRWWVLCVAFSPDGKILASGSDDSTDRLRLWDVATGKHTAFQGHSGSVYSVAFSRDGKTLTSGSTDGTVKLWEVPGGKNTATLEG